MGRLINRAAEGTRVGQSARTLKMAHRVRKVPDSMGYWCLLATIRLMMLSLSLGIT
jgi:hypothetical protein